MDKINAFLQSLKSFSDELINYFPKILLAILILFLGWKIINLLINILRKKIGSRKIDKTLYSFLIDLFNWSLKISIVLIAAVILGVKTASFITFFGTIGLAIGLALQGTLTNVAGGVLLLMLKPIQVGDLIKTQDHTGFVKAIRLFTTELKTFQNEIIIIPNSQLSNERIQNFSRLGKVRIDISIGVSYEADIDKTKQILHQAAKKCRTILPKPETFVGVYEMADSSVNFSVRVWTKPADYWETYFCIQENIKKELDKNSIEIPFPQRVVHHINKQKTETEKKQELNT